MLSDRRVKKALLASASVALVLGLSACGHTNGFSGGIGSGIGGGGGDIGLGGGSGAGGGDNGGGGGTGAGGGGTGTGGGGDTGGGKGSGSGAGDTGLLTTVSNKTGDLAGGVLVTTGNALLGGVSTGLGATVAQVGEGLQNDGLGGLPVAGGLVKTVTTTGDKALNGAANVNLLGQTVIGSNAEGATQLVGANVLGGSSTGQLATVSVLNNGTSSPTGATQLANIKLGNTTLLGSPTGGPALIGAGLLSASAPAGTVASLGLLPNAGAGGGGLGGVLSPVTSVVGGVLPGGGASGGALGGVLAPVTSVGGGVLPVGGAGSGGAGVLGGVLTPVTNTVSSVLGAPSGGSGGGLLGGVLTPVNSVLPLGATAGAGAGVSVNHGANPPVVAGLGATVTGLLHH